MQYKCCCISYLLNIYIQVHCRLTVIQIFYYGVIMPETFVETFPNFPSIVRLDGHKLENFPQNPLFSKQKFANPSALTSIWNPANPLKDRYLSNVSCWHKNIPGGYRMKFCSSDKTVVSGKDICLISLQFPSILCCPVQTQAHISWLNLVYESISENLFPPSSRVLPFINSTLFVRRQLTYIADKMSYSGMINCI